MQTTGVRGLILLLLALQTSCISPPDTPVAPPPAADSRASAVTGALAEWRALLDASRNLPEARKLEAVNAFFNRLDFVDDIDRWQMEDYWATPLETLQGSGGDCEDLAIAKYFSLRELGVAEERLRLTYVRARSPSRAHMVLAYYPAPDAEPLVLDSLVPDIRRASERSDLIPVFSFNAKTLWVAGARQSSRDAPARRIASWRNLERRMGAEQAYTAL